MHAGLRFTLILHNLYRVCHVFGAFVREKFRIDLTISRLDITLEFFSFYYVYTSACNLVYVFLCVIAVKVDVCGCEDRVKLNYSRLILSQSEPKTNYVESKEKHTKEI